MMIMPGTTQGTEYARMRVRDESTYIQVGESFLRRTATLKTPTTCVEVKEISWQEPAEFIFRANRPVFTLLVSVSTDSLEAGYVGGDVRRLNKIGDVVFTPPDREILSRCRSMAGKVHSVTCSLDREYAEHIVGSLTELSQAQLLCCLNIRSSLLPSVMLRLRSEAMHPGFVSAAVTESLGHAMLVEWSHMISSAYPKQPKQVRLTPRHFRIIDEYLANLLYETPSIEAIAIACGMSARYLTKLFREQTNQSLGQYLRCAQISKARVYLRETDLPLKEISYRLGFSTPANFSIAFRTATGETPGRFRTTNPL